MNWLLFISFNFVLYSFLGWVIEEVYSYFSMGYFKTDGFLSIPLKPMYGLAICILIFFYYKLEISKTSLILLSLLVPTLIEFISGYMLINIYNKQFWDYSKVKFNLQGIICLRFSIFWAILSVLAILYLQPLITRYYQYFFRFNNVIAFVLVFYILIDFGSISVERIKELVVHNQISNSFRQGDITEKKSP